MRRPSGARSKPVGVCIAGVGLIGGSLGMALRRARRGGHRAYHVTGLTRTPGAISKALRKGAIDAGSTRPSEALESADIVVLCVPVQDIAPLARRLKPYLPAGAIVTDVGSVKAPIVTGMKTALSGRKDLSFVGGHPMAGSEKNGVENAEASLFRGATCVLTGGPARATEIVRRLWKDAGSICVDIPAAAHDHWIALTSHLPHLLAFSLVTQVSKVKRRDPRIGALIAGSFRDMTRVAAADPTLWSGVLSLNRAAVTSALRDLMRHASALGSQNIRRLRPAIARVAADKKALG